MRELSSSAAGREMSEDEIRDLLDRASEGIMNQGHKPLTDEASVNSLIASLSSCIIQLDHSSECTICSEAMDGTAGSVISLPCSHSFHQPCIKTWFLTTGKAKPVRLSCPTCRAAVAGGPSDSLDAISPAHRQQPVTTNRIFQSLALSIGISEPSQGGTSSAEARDACKRKWPLIGEKPCTTRTESKA